MEDDEKEAQEDNGPDCLVYGESSLLDAIEETRGVYGSTIYPRSLFETMEHERTTSSMGHEGGADGSSPNAYTRSAYSHSSECQSFIDPPHPESTLFSALRAGSLTQLTAGHLHDASLRLTLPGKLEGVMK